MKKLILFLLIVPIVSFGQSLSAEKKSFNNLFKKLDNTGKWGQNDRLGTINYITSEKVKSSLK